MDELLYYYKDNIKFVILNYLNTINDILNLKIVDYLLRDCQSLIIPHLLDKNLSENNILTFNESFIYA